jgi:EmrB/QacA subfamily drug resistance transporter
VTTAPRLANVSARAARPGIVLAVCSLSVFLTGLDSTIVTIGMPAIGRSLHVGVSGLQWAADAYTVTLASLLMTAGSAADRFGRRAVLQAGLSVFVLGSWLCSLAPSLAALIAFRVLQGAGASAMNPAALGIITNVYTDPARRARALGAWDAAFGLSMVTGPVAGGILIGLAGWRSVFWASIPAGLAALALTGLFAPDSRAPAARRTDPAGQVLVTVMLAALAAAIIQAPAWGWLSWQTMMLLAAAAGALTGLARIEPRRSDPLIQLRLFRSARFTAAIISGVCGIAALAGFGFLSTLYLQDVRGLSALNAGLTIGPMAAEMAVCAPLAGRLIARRGARIPAVVAGMALAVSSAALSRLTGLSSETFLAWTYSLFGVGAGLLNPVVTYGVMSSVPDGQAGVASGMNSSSRQLGQCLGIAVTGTVLNSSLHGSMQAGFPAAARGSWLVMAGCGLLVLTAGLAGTRRRATRPTGRHARHAPAASRVLLLAADGLTVAAGLAGLRHPSFRSGPLPRHARPAVPATTVGLTAPDGQSRCRSRNGFRVLMIGSGSRGRGHKGPAGFYTAIRRRQNAVGRLRRRLPMKAPWTAREGHSGVPKDDDPGTSDAGGAHLDWRLVQARLDPLKHKWDLAILCNLEVGSGCRPKDLLVLINAQAGTERQLSPQVLSGRLRHLEQSGYVRHVDLSVMPLHRTYYLQPPGKALIMDLARIIGHAHAGGG